MRRSTMLVAGLCVAGVLLSGAAGLAVATGATGSDAGLGNDSAPGFDSASGFDSAPGQGLAKVISSTAVPRPPPIVVTVPGLPTTEAPPLPPPTMTAAQVPPGSSEPAPAPAPEAANPGGDPVLAATPAPAPTKQPPTAEGIPAAPPPADEPVNPPYSTILGWHGEDRVAYLTFDDGPGPYTGAVLDILAAAGVRATFCQIGQKVTENPGLTRRVVTEGHTLCNHSWDHYSPFETLPGPAIDQQIALTQNTFQQATGITVKYFRAPEGRFGNPGGVVLQAAQRAGTIPLGWGVDSLDWQKPGAPSILATVLANVSPGAIILLHDGGGADREETLAALPGIISGLQAAGYTLAALSPDPAG